jgi:hypothetical protein
MGARRIAVAGIVGQHVTQMNLVDDDQVVETFVAYRTNDPLGVTVLPS